MKAYQEGTMLMLGEVIARIGCGASMPADHKNDWLQNRFSLKPAGRVRVPGHKGNHLVWREVDVEKSKKMWEARPNPISPRTISKTVHFDALAEKPQIEKELEAIGRSTPGWVNENDAVPVLMRTAAMLLQQAAELMGNKKAVPA